MEGIREKSCEKCVSGPPMDVPWPQVVSRTGITECVASRAVVRDFAMRESEDERVVWFVAPGLDVIIRRSVYS